MNSPNELSFLPDDYLERKAQRRTNVICACLFLVVMVAIGSAFSITERSTRDIDKLHEAKLREYASAAQRIQQAEQMQEKQRTMSRQAELAASLLEKVPRSFVLAEFTNSLPPGVSLLDFSLESKKRDVRSNAAAAAAVASGGTAFEQRQAAKAAKLKAAADTKAKEVEAKTFDVIMKVTGIAYSDVQVAQFITKLNQSKMLKDVNLVITDEFGDDKEQLRKFQIECTLDPTAEINPDASTNTNKTANVDLKTAR